MAARKAWWRRHVVFIALSSTILASSAYLFLTWRYGGRVQLPWGWMAMAVCAPTLLIFVDLGLTAHAKRLERFRHQHGLCLHCGYSLQGLEQYSVCPECGAATMAREGKIAQD